MPSVVTGAFAASFVAAMGTANLGGRFLSATTSDKLANMTVSAPLCLTEERYSLLSMCLTCVTVPDVSALAASCQHRSLLW